MKDTFLDTWLEKAKKHETLHNGNCYCDDDQRCSGKFEQFLKDFHNEYKKAVREEIEGARGSLIESALEEPLRGAVISNKVNDDFDDLLSSPLLAIDEEYGKTNNNNSDQE